MMVDFLIDLALTVLILVAAAITIGSLVTFRRPH